jgi:hypothetical protein
VSAEQRRFEAGARVRCRNTEPYGEAGVGRYVRYTEGRSFAPDMPHEVVLDGSGLYYFEEGLVEPEGDKFARWRDLLIEALACENPYDEPPDWRARVRAALGDDAPPVKPW